MDTEVANWIRLYFNSNQESQGRIVRIKIINANNSNSKEHQLSKAFLHELTSSWRQGYNDLPDFVTEKRPPWGVMRSIGYNVGRNGVTRQNRQVLLKFVFEADELPPVQDKSYMNEWGKPLSSMRYSKILRFLTTKAKEEMEFIELGEAVDDRIVDLEFCKKKMWNPNLS